MKGVLNDQPVGPSHIQFASRFSRARSYCLYVVERAGTGEDARIVRIQDPAGKTGTFTFDCGWLNVAEVDGAVGSDSERG